MLKITDRPGVIPSTTMRTLFEESIRQTKVFAKNTPLGAVTVNGVFSHYADPDTDTMWIGFAIGMRCAERLQKAAASPAQEAEKPGAGA